MGAKLLVVGGGKMGSALLTGLVASGWATPGELVVAEPDPQRRAALAAEHPGLSVIEAVTPDRVAPGLLGPEGGALLAVKPDVAESACRQLAAVGVTRVLSIVAGIASLRLEACLPADAVVVRAMPNTPALVGAGVTVVSGGERATAADLDWAEGVLGAVGTVVRLPERQLDAVTGVSGCGPAYLFLVAESLIEAGVLVGLSREVSRTLVVGTLLGSARLLAETGEAPETLRAAVTSPGGATAAGVRTLEARAVRSAFVEAVASATERSRNLGR
jgi:pyrroline-5-carboxylate reductase